MRSSLYLVFALFCLGARASDPAAAIKAPDPETSKPVTAILSVMPAKLSPGKTATMVIKVRILPSHHIYGLNKSGGENTPTTFQLKLPKGVKLKGAWKAPEPKKGKDKSRIYEGEVVFTATLVVDKKAPPGKHTLQCQMEYQVCDEDLCLPPAKLDLATGIEVTGS